MTFLRHDRLGFFLVAGLLASGAIVTACGDDAMSIGSGAAGGASSGGMGGAAVGGELVGGDGAGTSGGSGGGGGSGEGGSGGGGFVELTSSSVDASGALVLDTNVPLDADACDVVPGAPCVDADGDGLNDAWEAIAIDWLRPVVRLDEDEKLLDEPGFATGIAARITPDGSGVLAYLMLGYATDFGSCGGLSAHNGDSERVALQLARTDPSRSGSGGVRVVEAYTAAHEGTINDHGRVFDESELDELEYEAMPMRRGMRWIVYASANKHATYATADICEGASFIPCIEEDCAPDGVGNPSDFDLLMDYVNAGEPDAPLDADLGALGFLGEDAWSGTDFCGGLGGNSCSAPVSEKLTVDPF